LFIEIRVTHESTDKKKFNNKVIEISINCEDDIRRIEEKLDEKIDTVYNFDDCRTIEKRLSRSSEYKLIFKNYRQSIINNIIKEFKNKNLTLNIKYCKDIFGAISKGERTEILLNDFYKKIYIIGQKEEQCVLISTNFSKLFITFQKINNVLNEEDHYIKLFDKPIRKPYLGKENIEDTSIKLYISQIKEDAYILKVNCFIPKDHYSNQIIELTIKELKDLIEQDKIDIVTIESIRKVSNNHLELTWR